MPVSSHRHKSSFKAPAPVDTWLSGHRLAFNPAYDPVADAGDMHHRITYQWTDPGHNKFSGYCYSKTTRIADMGIHLRDYHTSYHQLDSARQLLAFHSLAISIK